MAFGNTTDTETGHSTQSSPNDYNSPMVPYSILMDEDACSKDPEKDANMVERYYSEQHYMKYFLEREWYINYAFFHGKQWVCWNRVTNRVEELPRIRRGEVRQTTNLIWPRVMSMHANLAGSQIQHYIMPRSNSEEDREAARLSHKVLTWLRETTNYDAKWRDAAFNAILTGTCFLKPYIEIIEGEYDEEAETDEFGNIIYDNNGDMSVKRGPKFKINVDVVSPFDVLIDKTATKLDNSRWVIQVKVRPMSYIKEHYPKYKEYIQPDVDTRLAHYFEQRIQNLSDSEGPFTNTSLDNYSSEPHVTIKEYWEAPSKDWPCGRILTVINRVLVRAVENYIPDGMFGFFPIFYYKNPMRFWGSTFVTHLIPLQKEYNRRRSLVIESILKMGKLKWLLPKGAGVQDFAIDTEVGEIIEYNPIAGIPPTQASLQPLPQYVVADQSTLVQEMDMVSGQADTTRAISGMPKNVRTMGAAAMIQEMEHQKMFPIFQQHDDTHETLFSVMLKLFEKFILMDQKITIYDIETDTLDSVEASGDDLKGNTRVVVQSGREFPQSKQVKRAEIMQYYQLGLLGSPGDDRTRKRVLRLLEFGDVAQIFSDNSEEEALIIDENQMMKHGELPEVEEFHDHWLHLELHDKDLKSIGHKMDPEVKALYIKHRQAHGQRLDKIMQMSAPPPGAQPQKGKPGPKGKGNPMAQGARGGIAPQPGGIPGGMGGG